MSQHSIPNIMIIAIIDRLKAILAITTAKETLSSALEHFFGKV